VRRRAGFTLVETLLALVVVTLLVGLTVGWDRLLMRANGTSGNLYALFQTLEQPGRYQYVTGKGSDVLLWDNRSKKYEFVTLDGNGTVKLTGINGRGYVPLIQGIQTLDWRPIGHTGLVRLRVKRRGGKTWENTVIDLRAPDAAS